MSKRESSAPSVPPAEEPLVSRLRDLFAPLTIAQGDQSGLFPGSQTQLLHSLFQEGGKVPLAEARRDLCHETVDLLLDIGLLVVAQGEVCALFKLQTFKGLLFLADLPRYNKLADYVLPIGAAGRFMARLAIRRPVDEALDMGCGTGIQALLAASHARRVTATDINPRALALTRLNALLNGIDNIETRQGSHFEPLGECTFDLILFNAPYIISPLTKRPHSHAGSRGDAYLYDLLSALPGRLKEWGFAQIVANWTHRESEAWWAPLQAALTGRGLDALVLCRASLPARQYAGFWLKYEVDRERYPGRYALTDLLWQFWYRRHRIERIGFGSIVLRRRSAAENWLRCEKATASFGDSLSDQLLAVFHNQDRFAQRLPPDELTSGRPRLVNIDIRPEADGQGRRLVFTAGQIFPLQVRRITEEVIKYLDGHTTLVAAIYRAAQQDGLQADVVRPAVLEDMINLARYGWIALDP